jgi:hypothetical protein
MHRHRFHIGKNLITYAVLVCLASLWAFSVPLLRAQKPDLEQRVADLKESSAKNKQALAQYTWTEDVIISLKGQQRKQEHFQVRMGPDGKPLKTPLDPTAAASDDSSGRGRLRQRIIERKKEEYEDYAERMKALAQRYIPPDKDAIQDAYTKGNIAITPGAGGPSRIKLVIRDYVKPQDSMTLLFDKDQKQLLSINIATYLDDPQDAMNLTVRFARLPDGTNHVSSATIEGVSKQLTVATQNSAYHKL